MIVFIITTISLFIALILSSETRIIKHNVCRVISCLLLVCAIVFNISYVMIKDTENYFMYQAKAIEYNELTTLVDKCKSDIPLDLYDRIKNYNDYIAWEKTIGSNIFINLYCNHSCSDRPLIDISK